MTVRLSPSNCRWGCPCPCHNRTSISPTRSRRTFIRPVSKSSASSFRILIEKADQELVLQRRQGKGGAGIQRRGTRPFSFKTTFGEVTVERSRISHNHDGTIETPSATVWNTSHQLAITENLRDAVCDQMSHLSAGKSCADVCQYAGDESLLGRSTIIDIVHQDGEQLIVARTRACPRGPGRSV